MPDKIQVALLVGGLKPSEKYWSVGMIIPNIWKHNELGEKHMTNHEFASENSRKLGLRSGQRGQNEISRTYTDLHSIYI